MSLWHKLLQIDSLIRLYMEHGGVRHAYSGMSGLARIMQKNRQAEWIGKSVKGQANQKQRHRLVVFNSWFKTKTVSDLKQTQVKLFADYKSYCNNLNEKPYSKNIFPVKLKEAKKNKP